MLIYIAVVGLPQIQFPWSRSSGCTLTQLACRVASRKTKNSSPPSLTPPWVTCNPARQEMTVFMFQMVATHDLRIAMDICSNIPESRGVINDQANQPIQLNTTVHRIDSSYDERVFGREDGGIFLGCCDGKTGYSRAGFHISSRFLDPGSDTWRPSVPAFN